MLLETSCSGSATPTVDQATSEPPSSTSTEQVTDFSASVPKITAGQHLRFDTISLELGLSQSTVFCMLQGSQGYMWFGTEDRLNKYDGQNFTVYKHDPDNSNILIDNWIWVIHEDHLGALWIGTLNGGLDRYDRELDQFSHYQHDPDNTQSLSHNEVLAIHEDPDGVLWIGTHGGGLDRFDRKTETFAHFQNDPSDPHSLSHHPGRPGRRQRSKPRYSGLYRQPQS